MDLRGSEKRLWLTVSLRGEVAALSSSHSTVTQRSPHAHSPDFLLGAVLSALLIEVQGGGHYCLGDGARGGTERFRTLAQVAQCLAQLGFNPGSWVPESVILASDWEGEGWACRGGPVSFETSGWPM